MSEKIVPVALGERSYDIKIEAGLIASGRAAEQIARIADGHRVCLVTHPKLQADFVTPIANGLRERGITPHIALLPPGERSKNLKSIGLLYEAFLEAKIDRKSLIVAIGGGVIGDMAGFAAATYLRGIDYVQVPTTLLAQVDSSVGGKTGVDLLQGKNLVGAFHQPRLVLIDPDTLDTLPLRELRSGMAEIIKYGIIYDAALFDQLEKQMSRLLDLDKSLLATVIARSCEIKAEIVAQDETEQGLRAILNFGHTIGHALEALTAYRTYKHGEAIAIGMAVESRSGEMAGVTEAGTTERILSAMRTAGLATRWPSGISADRILQMAQLDKKTVSGKLHFALPRRIGECFVSDAITDEIVRKSLR